MTLRIYEYGYGLQIRISSLSGHHRCWEFEEYFDFHFDFNAATYLVQ